MHQTCPTNLCILSTWRTLLLIKSNFLPLYTCLFLAENPWRKIQLWWLKYLWPNRALTDTQWYCSICWSQSLSHFPVDNFILFCLFYNLFYNLSLLQTCIAVSLLLLHGCVSYSSTNTEAMSLKLPGSQPHIHPLPTSLRIYPAWSFVHITTEELFIFLSKSTPWIYSLPPAFLKTMLHQLVSSLCNHQIFLIYWIICISINHIILALLNNNHLMPPLLSPTATTFCFSLQKTKTKTSLKMWSMCII